MATPPIGYTNILWEPTNQTQIFTADVPIGSIQGNVYTDVDSSVCLTLDGTPKNVWKGKDPLGKNK